MNFEVSERCVAGAVTVGDDGKAPRGERLEGHCGRPAGHDLNLDVVTVEAEFDLAVTRPMQNHLVAFGHLDGGLGIDDLAVMKRDLEDARLASLGECTPGQQARRGVDERPTIDSHEPLCAFCHRMADEAVPVDAPINHGNMINASFN